MKSAFEEWAESKYGDSLMVPSGALAAWNAAVVKCHDLVDAYRANRDFDWVQLSCDMGALEDDFHTEGE